MPKMQKRPPKNNLYHYHTEREEKPMELYTFLEALSSRAPTPGGGAAAGYCGALATSLCSMVANITAGNKKYEDVKGDMERLAAEAEKHTHSLYGFINEDMKVFAPVSEAYSIPKDNPERDEILERALMLACEPPMQVMLEVNEVLLMCEELAEKGSKMLLSDVACAAAIARATLQCAFANVKVNTRLLKNREMAEKFDCEALELITQGVDRAEAVYHDVMKKLR